MDHVTATPFARPEQHTSRLRPVLFALALAAFALVALMATAILLFLSARAQMRFQTSPTDIKYAPAQRIPAAPAAGHGGSERSRDDESDEASDREASVVPGGYGGIVPGIPGIGAGPLFPAAPAPAAPAYTPAPPAKSDVKQPVPGPAGAPTATPAPSGAAAPSPAPATGAGREPAHKPADEAGSPSIRRVGGKTFRRDASGVLVDTAYREDSGAQRKILIAGSPDYIGFLESRPDLRQYFRLSDRLIVVVDDVIYQVIPKQ